MINLVVYFLTAFFSAKFNIYSTFFYLFIISPVIDKADVTKKSRGYTEFRPFPTLFCFYKEKFIRYSLWLRDYEKNIKKNNKIKLIETAAIKSKINNVIKY